MKISKPNTRDARRRMRMTLPVLLLSGAAFAATPVPATNLQSAQQAIANAERVEAATYSAVELGEAHLVAQGVSSMRLTSAGRGENSPIADNESAAGRQQNRRVEVVIDQPAVE